VKKLSSVVLLFFPAFATAAPAQIGTSTPAALEARLAEKGNDMLRAEMHGQSERAFDTGVEILIELSKIDVRQSAQSGLADVIVAHGSVVADALHRLANWSSLHGELLRRLTQLTVDTLPPHLAARVLMLRGECASAIGDRNGVREVSDQLGFLSDWSLIGPFDNERGGGFQKKEEPENGWASDLDVRGKERNVRWRRVPVESPLLGVLELKDLMRPNEQAACYLRTAFRVTKRQIIHLRFGSSEAIKVWIDGSLGIEANVRRPLGFDQNVVAAELEEGWHEVLVKVCTQELGWKFRCRLTDADGVALTRVETDSVRVVAHATTDRTATQSVADPAIAYFAGLAGLHSPDQPAPASTPAAEPQLPATPQRAYAALRLSLAIRARHAEDIADFADRAAAKLATDILPQDALAHTQYALSLRQESNLAEEKELNSFRREMEKAFELDPQDLLAAVHLSYYYAEQLPIAHLARLWIDRVLKLQPNNPWGALYLSTYFDHLNLDREMERVLEDCVRTKAGARHARILELLGERKLKRGVLGEGEALLRRALEANRLSTTDAARELRQHLLRQARFDEAIQMLKNDAQLSPCATWPWMELARIYQIQKNKEDMLAAYDMATRLCPDDAKIYTARAHSLTLFDDQEAATRALERAVSLDPKDRTSRRYLEFLKSNVKPFEDEFRVDGIEYIKNAPPSVADADEPYEVLLNQIAYKLNPDGTTQRYEHILATILNDEGAKSLDSYGVSHDAEDEQVRIRRARVIRKDGRVDDAPAPPGTSWVKFPPLSVGDTIDVEARVDTIQVGIFGSYFGTRQFLHGLRLASTRKAEQIYVTTVDHELHFKSRNGAPEVTSALEKDKARRIYRVSMLGLKKPHIESAMPDVIELAPVVCVSTYATWDDFTSWWWNMVEKECQSSPAIRDKVSELVAGKTSEIDRIRAIYEFVVTDVRYNAWEFGIHGYKPYSASTIFDRRYGDCKDKAILITTMLKDAGIESYPVIIYADETRPIEDLSLPMIGIFNHCIAYVPAAAGRPELFLDGTATHHPMGVLPDMDHGARVVVVNKGKPDLRDVKYPSPETNMDSAEYRLDVQPDGSAKGSVVLRPRGRYDVRIRSFFANEKGAQKENLERLLSARLGRLQVGDVQTSDLNKLSEPVEIKTTLEVEKLAKTRGAEYTLALTFDPRNLLGIASETERKYDLLLGTPESEESTITYTVPSNMEIKSIPADCEATSPFGSFSVKTTRKGNEIVVSLKSTLSAVRVHPSEYAEFRKFARALDEAQAHEIVLGAK
jgi:Tfp pilus assembly protein PilF